MAQLTDNKILKALGKIYCFIKREHDYNFVREWSQQAELLFNQCMICGNKQLLDIYMYDMRVPILHKSGDIA